MKIITNLAEKALLGCMGLAFTLTCTTENVAADEAYENSWQNRAIQLQIKLDINEPLGSSTFLYTHNSYNSAAYANLGSYWDPNHQLSVAAQLDMGVRALELDVHWTSNDLLLCHGTNDHTGCSAFDRRFEDTIKEINTWLRNPARRYEVLTLYLEDHVDGRYSETLAVLNQHLGDLIHPTGGCRTMPQTISKWDILAAGHQILLIGGNCATAEWSASVYRDHWPTQNDSFSGFPECTTRDFNATQVAGQLVRIYEDATWLTSTFGDPPQPITPEVMRDAVKCGLGIVGAEPLTEFDERMRTAIWSWAENEPRTADGHWCAVQDSDGRFYARPCEQTHAFVCRNAATEQGAASEWRISSGPGTWAEGDRQCREEFGSSYRFDMPRSGYQNERVKQLAAGQTVWLNYVDRNADGNWLPGDYPVLPEPEPGTVVWKKLRNDHGRCLDLEGRETHNGNEIHHWQCHGADSQLWWQDAYGRIHNKMAPEKCVDVSGSGTAEGTRIVLWDCHQGDNQRWLRGSQNSLRPVHAPGMALDIKDPFWGDGMPAHLWEYHGGKSQRWAWD